MEQAMQALTDAVAELQAQAHGNSTMLEALVMAHPDPEKLRECWHRISAPRIADAAVASQTKGRTVDDAVGWYLLKWQEKLERHHPEAGTPAS